MESKPTGSLTNDKLTDYHKRELSPLCHGTGNLLHPVIRQSRAMVAQEKLSGTKGNPLKNSYESSNSGGLVANLGNVPQGFPFKN